MQENINLSIIIPAYNEAENLPILINRLIVILMPLNINYEIIIVDDGSSDNTRAILAHEQEKNKNVKTIYFSRNFGHQAALNAGIDYSGGEAVVTMDADLQHPPELIGEMFREYKSGFDLVLGERASSKENNFVKNKLSKLFYFFINKISDFDMRANVADFNLYSRPVVNTLKQFPEKDRFLRGLVQWVGFKKKYIQYECDKRYSGISKYSFKKMMKLAITGITSFSAFPLRVAWWVGLTISLSGFAYGIYILYEYFFARSHVIAGWTSLAIVVLIIGGTQLMILGIMGEYLFKIFYEIKGRPLYIIQSTGGFSELPEDVNRVKYGISAKV